MPRCPMAFDPKRLKIDQVVASGVNSVSLLNFLHHECCYNMLTWLSTNCNNIGGSTTLLTTMFTGCRRTLFTSVLNNFHQHGDFHACIPPNYAKLHVKLFKIIWWLPTMKSCWTRKSIYRAWRAEHLNLIVINRYSYTPESRSRGTFWIRGYVNAPIF